jgi:hypothetical protein
MMTLLDHSQYLAETEKSHLFLEPFHYGGCNTVGAVAALAHAPSHALSRRRL